MIADFDETGRCLAICDSASASYPGTIYSCEVPDGTNPNAIYWNIAAGELRHKEPFPITVARNLISDIPEGTEARVSGRPPAAIVQDGALLFEGEAEGHRWVMLMHPLYLNWSGNVPVGPAPE